ncbi:MAG TPA: ABC transporter ATP-binding protein [Symbiobacteriaceae bacterium]|jgi:ATP-binding cassette, subfamily B, bacterial|nr:ABC transporter ATP-binding protein [Symbiobacteriaceae bacterium]
MNIPVKRYLALLARYLRPQWPKVALLAALLAGGISLQLYNPQILRRFLDAATSGADTGALAVQAVLFIVLALFNQLITALARYVGEQVSWTATNDLRADLAAHCLKLDLSFHKSRTPGEMVERIDGDITALSNFFSQMIIDIIGNVVLMAGVLLLLFREDWRAGLTMTIFAVVTLYVLGAIRAFAVPFWSEQRQVSAELFGFLGESLSGTEAIRSSGAVGHVMHRFGQIIQRQYRSNLRSGMTGAMMWSSSLVVFAMGTAMAFGLGAYLYTTGAVTLGTVYLIFNYTELLRRPIEQIRTQMQDLQKAGASIGRVEELTQTVSSIGVGGGRSLPGGALAVAFDSVSFEYEADDPVLQDLTFQLAPGQVMGLLGRTGSGKSTLARLLLRFYDPVMGSVRLGGLDLRDAALADVRRRVGFVTQDVQLFAASVRDNLTFFDANVSDERILTVLEELGMGAWARSLPNGLDTQLESGGGGLSAGEAQLLAFARVFLADPGLVILDEASSRLDPATEALVERAVSRLLAGRTGIIIAHRLATIGRANTILILEDGKMLEHGERTQLAADPASRFATLLRTGLEEVLA